MMANIHKNRTMMLERRVKIIAQWMSGSKQAYRYKSQTLDYRINLYLML